MERRFDVSVKLPITQGDIVFVPGGEPLSEMTSGSLVALYPYLYKRPFVRLCEILERIPEAKVQYVRIGSGMSAARPVRFIVFPDDRTDDKPITDWYAKLREIANSEEVCEAPVRDKKEYCNNISQPADDFISPYFGSSCNVRPPAEDIYREESEVVNTKAILPPLVGWQVPKKDFE